MYDKIKNICKKKKITISKLEEDLGLSQGSVCKWGYSISICRQGQKSS